MVLLKSFLSLLKERMYFNTSNVMVLHADFINMNWIFKNFNTSNVMVLHKGSAIIIANSEISIHPMLWFFSTSIIRIIFLDLNFNTSNVMVLLTNATALPNMDKNFNTSNVMVLHNRHAPTIPS